MDDAVQDKPERSTRLPGFLLYQAADGRISYLSVTRFSSFNPLILPNSLILFVASVPSWHFTMAAIIMSFGIIQ